MAFSTHKVMNRAVKKICSTSTLLFAVSGTIVLTELSVQAADVGGITDPNSSCCYASLPADNIVLKAGSTNQEYFREQSWTTSTGYLFIFQPDGNLVLYSPTKQPIWATGTNGTGANKLVIQADGNVVLYENSKALWATNTHGNIGAYFVIQGDGNVVVYNSVNKPIFWTGTDGGRVSTFTAAKDWSGYYYRLADLSESQWDEQSSDNTRFEANPFGGGVDERSKTDDRIEQIYTDLSNAIFGQRVAMTSGYAYDQSYRNGTGKWHAGLDMGAAYRTLIKAPVGGSVKWISGSGDGYVFVGINSDDGRQWVYGHLNSRSGLWTGKRINVGDTIGSVGWYNSAPHLHIEVENGHAYGNTQGAMTDQDKLVSVTVSPLMAYWQFRNR